MSLDMNVVGKAGRTGIPVDIQVGERRAAVVVW